MSTKTAMAPLATFLSLICLFFGSPALAGNAVWEPALAPRSSGTASLDKRSFFVVGNDGREPWPNRLIRYCFASNPNTQSRKSKLKGYLKAARQIWLDQGLNDNFHLQEVTDSVCESERDHVLLVNYTGATGGMATFVGFPKAGILLIDGGPSMQITDRTDMGMLDIVANFAHELGHAWGLYHEHQKPSVWGFTDDDEGEVFGPGRLGGWRCENLVDYARKSQEVANQGDGVLQPLSMEKMCRMQTYAWDHKFSASNYLPMINTGKAIPSGHGSDSIDWDSIMIYPSGAGGIPQGGGVPTAANDNRMPILLKPDGARIAINKAPSARDIAALEELYEDEGGTKLDLLNSAKNFKKTYKQSGSGPSGGSGCL